MLFVILARDASGSAERRPVHRPAHLAHLEEIDRAGKLILAGPLTDGTGSLIIVEAETQAHVWDSLARDPYVQNGIFESVEVHPFLQVFPKPA